MLKIDTTPTPFIDVIAQVKLSTHFIDQANAKGFTAEQIFSALTDPYKITRVTRYPGQWRYCGAGVAVVVALDRPVATAITLYLDGIVTPLREDQMNDTAAVNSVRINGC